MEGLAREGWRGRRLFLDGRMCDVEWVMYIMMIMMMIGCILGWLIKRTGFGKEYQFRFGWFIGRSELWREYSTMLRLG